MCWKLQILKTPVNQEFQGTFRNGVKYLYGKSIDCLLSVILPPCVPDETVKDRFCIVHTPDDQGVFVFADNSFFSGLWQRDSLPGSCSAVCHWMHEAPQVTLHPRRGNPPLLCSSHQGLQNSRQSFSVSEKSEFEFTFLYDTWFSLSSSWFKIIPIRRSYATTII